MEQQEDQRSESSELLALNVGNETIYTYTMSMKRPPTVYCGRSLTLKSLKVLHKTLTDAPSEDIFYLYTTQMNIASLILIYSISPYT
jgi:hypothetical protein